MIINKREVIFLLNEYFWRCMRYEGCDDGKGDAAGKVLSYFIPHALRGITQRGQLVGIIPSERFIVERMHL